MAQQAAPLVLEAPCITPAELEARVQPLLPAASNAPNALQGVQVRVRSAASSSEQEAEIVLPARADQPATTRTLRGESCETVIDAAIIVLGLWVSESAPAAPPPAAPAPKPVPPKPSEPQADDETEIVHWSLTLGAAVSHALLPSTALGVELGSALSWRTLTLALGGRWWPSQHDVLSSSQVAASLIEGDLQIGWLPIQLGSFELGPVVGLAIGELHVAGVDVEDSRERSLLWIRSELGLHARYRWSGTPLAVWATVGGAAPWSRPLVEIGGEGPVFQPDALSPYGALGVEWVLR